MKRKAMMALCFLIVWVNMFAQSEFSLDAGIYSTFLEDLKTDLNTDSRMKKIVLDGKERLMFVPWVRDHIHTMKAYKYWQVDQSSFINFFMDHQTPKGMYFDYCESFKNQEVGQLFFTNCFDRQFYYVDVNQQNFFFRMPMEADLEYLLVEGVFTNWQTNGDLEYVKKWLPVLVKGIKYLMNDPLRWSGDKLMVMRPYTIDTWDFSSQHDSLKGVDRLLGHIDNTENTPKGIMHGDNSGMFMACKMLSKLFNASGQTTEAKIWDLQGDLFRERLKAICWNGKFYSHFVQVDPYPKHIQSDPVNSIGLSNTYSINRGAPSPEMAESIIKTYQEIGEKTKGKFKASWFGIYPFIYPHFGNYPVGEYMNGAILPLVGGELAKAAFQNGFEEYAVDQLKTAIEIMKLNKQKLPGCVNDDGTAQKEAIPNEWGEAAFVSALVEGLAGVVDKSIMFKDVEISPRWLFAGVDTTTVKVGYGGDGNQVVYHYSANSKGSRVKITTAGKFDRFTMRIPVPQGYKEAKAWLNGVEVNVKIEKVHQTEYTSVVGSGNTNMLEYRFF